MFSLSKSLLVAASLCLASVGWGADLSMKSCAPNDQFKVEYKVADQTLSLAIEALGADGKPVQSAASFEIASTQAFTPDMFDQDTLSAMHQIAGISSFTGGIYMQVTSSGATSSFWFFEFEPGQHSVVWLANGQAYPLGKTNSCK